MSRGKTLTLQRSLQDPWEKRGEGKRGRLLDRGGASKEKLTDGEKEKRFGKGFLGQMQREKEKKVNSATKEDPSFGGLERTLRKDHHPEHEKGILEIVKQYGRAGESVGGAKGGGKKKDNVESANQIRSAGDAVDWLEKKGY